MSTRKLKRFPDGSPEYYVSPKFIHVVKIYLLRKPLDLHTFDESGLDNTETMK